MSVGPGYSTRVSMELSIQLASNSWFISPTPPKTNMEPENGPLEKEIPIGNHHFQVPAVNFWGCIYGTYPTYFYRGEMSIH